MQLKLISSLKNLKNKRVLLRLDLNVAVSKNKQILKTDAWRLDKALPTLEYLVKKQAKVIIIAHSGRPNGKIVKDLSLAPQAKYLSKLLKQKIAIWPGELTQYAEASHELANGQVVMLENIRYHAREQKNCKRLAKALSNLGDIYVNDAFGNIHRDHDTSMLQITRFLPSYAGFLIAEEVKYLQQILAQPKKLTMVFGGAKVSTKLFLIQKFLNKSEHILLGGMLANTVLASKGFVFNQASYDQKELKLAKKLNNKKIVLPLDCVVAKSLDAKKYDVLKIEQATKNNLCVDIGPSTVKEYLKILQTSKMIVWNGPLGYFENKLLTKNSQIFAKALAKLKQTTIIGGGETVELANRLGLLKQFNFVSTGGGAMMTFLEDKKLPALEALSKK